VKVVLSDHSQSAILAGKWEQLGDNFLLTPHSQKNIFGSDEIPSVSD
jgi:hypothetical protein